MSWKHGEIHWVELSTHDPQAARDWCETAFGWTFTETPVPGDGPDAGAPYLVAHHDGAPVAGIIKIAPPMTDGPRWLNYVAVDDVDTVAAAAPKCFFGPFEVPEVGRFAMIEDGGGALLGIITPDEDREEN